jgi:hypothetical protein
MRPTFSIGFFIIRAFSAHFSLCKTILAVTATIVESLGRIFCCSLENTCRLVVLYVSRIKNKRQKNKKA